MEEEDNFYTHCYQSHIVKYKRQWNEKMLSSAEINEDDNETAQSADIKARREARQRKILENAKSRLERINGRKADISDKMPKELNVETKTKVIYSDAELEQDTFNHMGYSNHMPRNSDLPFRTFGSQSPDINDLASLFTSELFKDDSLNALLGHRVLHQSSPKTTTEVLRQEELRTVDSFGIKLLKSKLHLALLSVLTYFVFIIGLEDYISYSVFLPLFLWEITESIVLRQYLNKPITPFASLAMMFLGVNPEYTRTALSILGILNKIFQDVSVFLFFFALCHIGSASFLRNADSDGVLHGEISQTII